MITGMKLVQHIHKVMIPYDNDSDSDKDENIVEEEEVQMLKLKMNPNTNITEQKYTPEEKEYNDLLDKYFKNKSFEDAFNDTFIINSDGNITIKLKN